MTQRRPTHLAALLGLVLLVASALPAIAACACGMPPASSCCSPAASFCCDGDAGDGLELRAPACERHVVDVAPDASLRPSPTSDVASADATVPGGGVLSTADPPGPSSGPPARGRPAAIRGPAFLLHSVFRI